ncbi:hypothetical protein EJ04DRAFT_609370 [Polyplosphaeria fusca]|uniref:Uncharacterized protein n=1 Tax=Polyplosphaeria fusca TaxID=682080 RepID=A0A9P4R9P1_9PLEO|nr:hypothetical protein EJ04DRAFT_609370 [Polyplosphaeria fusca]
MAMAGSVQLHGQPVDPERPAALQASPTLDAACLPCPAIALSPICPPVTRHAPRAEGRRLSSESPSHAALSGSSSPPALQPSIALTTASLIPSIAVYYNHDDDDNGQPCRCDMPPSSQTRAGPWTRRPPSCHSPAQPGRKTLSRDPPDNLTQQRGPRDASNPLAHAMQVQALFPLRCRPPSPDVLCTRDPYPTPPPTISLHCTRPPHCHRDSSASHQPTRPSPPSPALRAWRPGASLCCPV